VLSATVDLDPQAKGFVLTITVDEGQRYRFGTVDVISNIRDADADTFRRLLRVAPGKTYDAKRSRSRSRK
jgi:outer membrane protein insertion porin family